MIHRHLNANAGYTMASIDDVIARGSHSDWIDLRDASVREPSLLEKIIRVCAAKVSDPYEQRYHFWKYHAEHAIA